MNTQRKWDITIGLLIAIGLMVVMVPDSALAFWGPNAEEAGYEGAEYFCQDNGGVWSAETSGSGGSGWETQYECNDGSWGSFDWNCHSCYI